MFFLQLSCRGSLHYIMTPTSSATNHQGNSASVTEVIFHGKNQHLVLGWSKQKRSNAVSRTLVSVRRPWWHRGNTDSCGVHSNFDQEQDMTFITVKVPGVESLELTKNSASLCATLFYTLHPLNCLCSMVLYWNEYWKVLKSTEKCIFTFCNDPLTFPLFPLFPVSALSA